MQRVKLPKLEILSKEIYQSLKGKIIYHPTIPIEKLKKFFNNSIVTSDYTKADVIMLSSSAQTFYGIVAKEIEEGNYYKVVTNVPGYYNLYYVYCDYRNHHEENEDLPITRRIIKPALSHPNVYSENMVMINPKNQIRILSDIVVNHLAQRYVFKNSLTKETYSTYSKESFKEILRDHINTLESRKEFLKRNKKDPSDIFYNQDAENNRQINIDYCDLVIKKYEEDFDYLYDIYSNYSFYLLGLNKDSSNQFELSDLINKTVIHLDAVDYAMIHYSYRDKELPMSIEEAIMSYNDLGEKSAAKIISKWDDCKFSNEDYVRAAMYNKNLVPELMNLSNIIGFNSGTVSITPSLNTIYNKNLVVVNKFIEKLNKLIEYIKT
jgi:hypothetical protein